MKRIKSEEIQNSIQNYVLQRNLPCKNLICTDQNEKLNKTLALSNSNTKSNLVDMNLMALNDLALIESSIFDYYSLSFNSTSEADYLTQFEALKTFINKKKIEELEQFLFPVFVYTCIDLVLMGFSIKKILNNYINESRVTNFNTDQQCLLENLLLFDESKDLNKCKLNWVQNKYRLKLSTKNWKIFLKYLTKSKIHLLLRIFNLNLQIIVNDPSELDKEEEDDEIEKIEIEDKNLKIENFENDFPDCIFEDSIKEEKTDIESIILANEIKNENIEANIQCQSSQVLNDITKKKNSINLDSLNECIAKVNSQPSRINGACCFYVDDIENNITSSNISPDLETLAFTNENSTIYLYKLNDTLTGKTWPKKHLLNSKNYFKELVGGHTGVVFKSKFTHDSKYLVSCGSDGVACLWDINNKNETLESNEPHLLNTSLICSYSGHLYPCWDIEIFSRLNLFSTSSKDGTAKLWAFDHIYPLRSYCGHQSDVNTVRFHPNGSYLATGSSDKTVRLWSVQSSEFVRLFSGHRSRVFTVDFSPDGNYLASAGEDRKIKIWDLRSGSLYKELKGHTDIVHALKFDNNSEILCSGGLDKTVKFWDFHQKNITMENDSFTSNFKNDTLNSSKNSSKISTSSTSSNELMRSINVDFNVYSIECDIQNLFYFTGVQKQQFKNSNLNEQPNLAAENSILNSSLNSSFKIETSTSSIPKSKTHQFSSSNLLDNKFLITSTDTKSKARQKVITRKASAPPSTSHSIPTTTTPTNPNSISKSTINTRRRTALATSSSTLASNTPPPPAPNSTSYLFNNNDDLYEA